MLATAALHTVPAHGDTTPFTGVSCLHAGSPVTWQPDPQAPRAPFRAIAAAARAARRPPHLTDRAFTSYRDRSATRSSARLLHNPDIQQIVLATAALLWPGGGCYAAGGPARRLCRRALTARRRGEAHIGIFGCSMITR